MADAQEPKPSDGSDGAAPESAKGEKADLPVVVAPKLDSSGAADAGGFDAAEEGAGATAAESAASISVSRSLRFALLAASVAAAAGLGSFVGSLSASGVAHFWPATAASSTMAEASTPQALKAELAELSALKGNLEGASRNLNGQFAKLADRLDRVERAEAEPAAKIAHIAEAVDRLEKKGAMATGSAAAPAPETTGSIGSGAPPATAEAKVPDKILQNWVVQAAHGGRALVASRYGGLYEVAAGTVLPGLGRVETIKRQDGQWVVVTAGGLITER